jgi:fumarate hydratase subunit alpha
VRKIDFYNIAETIEQAYIEINRILPDDVLNALKKALQKETNPQAVEILNQLLENNDTAGENNIPLCQDTGLAVVFARQGIDTAISKNDKLGTLEEAVTEGVKRGYEKGYLRKSVVQDPLENRKNTGTNTPSIFYLQQIPGDKIELSLMSKGGGCENKSQFKMFNPTAKPEDITSWIIEVVKQAGANACPPFVIGVGIGGDFEKSCLLSKKALLNRLDKENNYPFYAKLEKQLLNEINSLGIGPQGLGGDTTALGVKIETAPCHIASLPVAVNIECHSHRHKSIII